MDGLANYTVFLDCNSVNFIKNDYRNRLDTNCFGKM